MTFRRSNIFIPRLCDTCLINRPVGDIPSPYREPRSRLVSLPQTNSLTQPKCPPSSPALCLANYLVIVVATWTSGGASLSRLRMLSAFFMDTEAVLRPDHHAPARTRCLIMPHRVNLSIHSPFRRILTLLSTIPHTKPALYSPSLSVYLSITTEWEI
jgi:hypothetical protein